MQLLHALDTMTRYTKLTPSSKTQLQTHNKTHDEKALQGTTLHRTTGRISTEPGTVLLVSWMMQDGDLVVWQLWSQRLLPGPCFSSLDRCVGAIESVHPVPIVMVVQRLTSPKLETSVRRQRCQNSAGPKPAGVLVPQLGESIFFSPGVYMSRAGGAWETNGRFVEGFARNVGFSNMRST